MFNHVTGDHRREFQNLVSKAVEVINEEKEEKRRKKRRKKPKRFPKLPKRLIVLENQDKKFHEKWYEGRDPLDFPHPFRMMFCAKPHCGKTNCIKNIIMRAAQGRKPFAKIVVIHCDPDSTNEYNDVDSELFHHIPHVQDIKGDEKTLVILEDLAYIDMPKEERSRLERLFGYVSTHKNISCMLTGQDIFRVIPTVRRCANVFVLWKSHDMDMIRTVSRKTGFKTHVLENMMNELCISNHDSIWIDNTDNSPYPVRTNGYTPVDITKYDY